MDRRLALGILGVAVLSTVAGFRSFFHHRAEFAATVKQVEARLGIKRPLEKLPKGCLIPEDERGGKNFLTSLVPKFSPFPVVGGYSFENNLSPQTDPLLAALPKDAHVRLLVPEESSDEALKYVQNKFPHLSFTTHGLPLAEDGYTYPQDMVSATGSVDEAGRFILAGSALEAKDFASCKQTYESTKRAVASLVPLRAVSDSLSNEDTIEEAGAVLHEFGDEILAERHGDSFTLKYVPVMTEGGDLKITRLPNGGIGLIVGKLNLSRTIMSMQLAENPGVADLKMLNEVGRDKFVVLLEKVKALYKEYFAVDEVIIIDEPYIRGEARRNGYVRHSGLRSYGFFHCDMLVRTATDQNGKAVAFCSSSNMRDRGDGGNCRYLFRVQEQFASLGYDVESMETGQYPSMNYANSVMFRNGEAKVVLVPQYGIRQDAAAVEAYRRRGFEVRVVDQSYIQKLPPEDKALVGGPDCKLVVLG